MTRDELRDWTIALVDHAQGYVGKRIGDIGGRVTLDPAYTLVGGYQLSGQGAARMRGLLPIEMLADITRITVSYSVVHHLDELSDADFADVAEQILKGVAIAEELRKAIRAQRSGVVLAPAGAKLPTIVPKPRGMR